MPLHLTNDNPEQETHHLNWAWARLGRMPRGLPRTCNSPAPFSSAADLDSSMNSSSAVTGKVNQMNYDSGAGAVDPVNPSVGHGL